MKSHASWASTSDRLNLLLSLMGTHGQDAKGGFVSLLLVAGYKNTRGPSGVKKQNSKERKVDY